MATDEVRNMRVDGVVSETVERLYPEVRTRYEPLIEAVQALPEVHVLAALSLRLYRLFLTAKAVSDAGLDDETKAVVRSAAESFVSFAYILDVGEEHPDETLSSRELAERFLRFADVSYAKFIRQRPAEHRNAFRTRNGWTDAQVDEHLADCTRKSDEAIANGSRKDRWHAQLNLVAMAARVSKYLPAYAETEFAGLLFGSFQLGNSAVHGDALFLRLHYREFENRPLTVALRKDATNADLVARIVVWAWFRIAIYFGDEEWLDGRRNEILRTVMRERWDAAPPEGAPTILRL